MVTILIHVENTQNIKEYYNHSIPYLICQIKNTFWNPEDASGGSMVLSIPCTYHTIDIISLSKEKEPCSRKALSLIRLLSFYVTLSIQRFLKQPILTQVIVLSLEHQCLVTLVLVVLVLESVLESQVFVALVFVGLELLI